MRNFKIAVIIIIFLAIEAVGFIWWMDKRNNTGSETSVTSAQHEGLDKDRKILYWKAPMDPTYISDKPGKSPMGMDLVPVYEDKEDASTDETAGGSEVYYTCPMHSEVVSEEPGECPMCGMDLVKKEIEKESPEGAYYTCPMHPDIIAEEPGDCPVCGMDLVKKEIKKESVVKLSSSVIQKMAVRTEDIERRTLKRSIRTIGRIDYDETKVFNINTKIEGWAEKLYVDYTGQVVKKGQSLIDIYSPELVNTQEEYLLALKSKESLKSSKFPEITQGVDALLNSTRKRLKLWDITDEQIETLEKTKETKKTMTIYSPVKGFVLDKNVLEGGYVKSQNPIYKIADISNIWVYADIYEYELPWIKIGQTAKMTLSYYPGKTFSGRITYIYPYLEKNTRTVKVRLEFSNPDWTLKPDMYANIEIESEIAKDGIAVPTEAIIRSGVRNIVVVDLGEGRFEPRNIELGAEADGYYQVLNGLHEGERIVTSSQFLIDSESKLKEAINKMLSKRKDTYQTDEEKNIQTDPHADHNM